MISLLALMFSSCLVQMLSLADPNIVNPSAGLIIPRNVTMTVRWEESGVYPLISSLESFDLHLCTGGHPTGAVQTVLTFLKVGDFKESYVNVSLKHVPILDEQVDYIYFFKMTSRIRTGGTVVNYSYRFGISHVGNSVFLTPSTSSTETPGRPERELRLPGVARGELRRRQAGDPYTVPLSLQFGPTIYAPMQSYPSTKITKSTASPQYPSSKVILATAPLPPNKSIQKTVTQAITWSFSQRENPNPAKTEEYDRI